MAKNENPNAFRQPRFGWDFFGSELKRRREVVGLTQQELGDRVFCSGAYIGQFETAIRKPQYDLAKRMDAELKTDGLFGRMCDDLINSSPHPAYFTHAAYLESLATSIGEYAPTRMPGLLQTESYARALMRPSATLNRHRNVDALVRERMERAALLDDPTKPVFWAVLHESVLRIPVGGPAVMAVQLTHIAGLIRRERIIVQILPFSAGAWAASSGMFNLMTFDDAPPVVYFESQHAGQLLDEPALVRKYQREYDLLRAAALSPEASLSLIESVSEDYTHER
ncbi:Scr1 family TA system antitoxin-like transcriptional regulator [Streptomyces sp. NPDC088725]|uniref:helix-turn-helix domain-containing protein n=1 Tax=Streptomyces sp. NPDC088725 TaxID=3365873 RepID=UPI00380F1715